MPKQPRPSKLLNQINVTRQFLAIKAAKEKGESILFLNNSNKKEIANPDGSIDILPLTDKDFEIYLIQNNLIHILQECSSNVEQI